jgi:hypothetical protein
MIKPFEDLGLLSSRVAPSREDGSDTQGSPSIEDEPQNSSGGENAQENDANNDPVSENKRKAEESSDDEANPPKKLQSNDDSEGPNGPSGTGGFSGPSNSGGSQGPSNGSEGGNSNYSIIFYISSFGSFLSSVIENLF